MNRPTPQALLAQIPDWNDSSNSQRSLRALVKKIQGLRPESRPFYLLNGASVLKPESAPAQHPFFSDAARKLILACYLADLACYPNEFEQVSLSRLAQAICVFPRGFNLLWVQTGRDSYLPVGYTAWHPISETQFQVLTQKPAKSSHQKTLPGPPPDPEGKFLYLFNYSVTESVKKTEASRVLIKNYAKALPSAKGLSCITVSQDGARIAKKFGMTPARTLRVCGKKEVVFSLA